MPLVLKTIARCAEMYSLMHSPAKCKHIGDMSGHLGAWERKIDDFVIMGGQRLNDPEICITVPNKVPADTPAFFVQALEAIPTTRP